MNIIRQRNLSDCDIRLTFPVIQENRNAVDAVCSGFVIRFYDSYIFEVCTKCSVNDLCRRCKLLQDITIGHEGIDTHGCSIKYNSVCSSRQNQNSIHQIVFFCSNYIILCFGERGIVEASCIIVILFKFSYRNAYPKCIFKSYIDLFAKRLNRFLIWFFTCRQIVVKVNRVTFRNA